MSRYGVSGLAPRDNTNVAQKLTLDQALVNYEPPKLEPGAGHMGDPVKDHEAKLKYIMEAVHFNPQNLMGCTAGAGSGDFHQYRQARRKEQFRLERMEKEYEETMARQAFEERQRKAAAEAEARTSKKREKRLKKKGKKRQRTEGAGGEKREGLDGSDSDSDSDGGEARAHGAKGAADLD